MASIRIALGILASFVSAGRLPVTQTTPDYGGGQYRQGVFTERTLTQTNVGPSTFGRIGTLTVDGLQVYAQPLFVQGVTIGTGTFDLVIVATMGNSIYAFDANALTQVWKTNFGARYANYPGHGNSNDALYDEPVGCMSTPVVDQAAGKVFAACVDSSGNWWIRSLNLATGAVLASTEITGQVTGTGMSGDTVIGGQLQFFAAQELQRTGLTLVNGTIYFAFASYGDTTPWHGWIFGYSESLSQTAIMCVTPNGAFGGIWMSGDALPVDSAGNLYASTGNGDYNGTTNFANSVLKLSPSLAILDWFTPTDWATLEANDLDVTSGRAILLGDGNVIVGGKDYREFSLNTACMGHLQSSGTCTQQIWTLAGGGHYGIFGGIFFANMAYLPVNSGPISAFPYSGGTFTTASPAATSLNFGHAGARMAVSANGTQNAVLWAATCVNPANGTPQPGILRAYNPSTLVELYDSTQNAGDALGTFSKLGSPLIASGRVFVGTGDGTVAVYGLK